MCYEEVETEVLSKILRCEVEAAAGLTVAPREETTR
jgi:hypothetical protein